MATVTPGKQLAEGELVTREKLNLLGAPVVQLDEGEVGARELDASAVRQLVPYVNRNLLINGNFDVWQRWKGAINPPFGASASLEWAADRWALSEPSGVNKRSVTAGLFTMGQTAVPNEPTYYLHWEQLVAESGAYIPTLQQPVEDVRTLAGKSAVVSWWMKSNTSLSVTCSLTQFFGGSPGQYRVLTATSGGTATVTGGATWVQFTAKFDVTSLFGYGSGGENSYIAVGFQMPQNATYQIDFAQVQLEEGTLATSYETIPYLETVRRCERYYEYHAGVAWSDITAGSPCYYFATKKYRAPTLALVAGYAGTMTAANFSTLLNTGYYQDTANSVVSTFFMSAEAEIY